MIKLKYNFRHATQEDVDHFYLPEEQTYSMKAWVLECDEEKYAIGGVWLVSGKFTAFCKSKTGLPVKTFWKVSKIVIDELRKLQLPIVAIRDQEVESSQRYLTKLGFAPFDIQNNKQIFKLWHK